MIDTKQLKEDFLALNKSIKNIAKGPDEYYIDILIAAYEELLRHAEFRVGDEFVLIKKVDFKNAPGWAGCKHFMKPGATGKVIDVSYNLGGFSYGVEFDDESFVHPVTGKIEPILQKHIFHFRSGYLKRAVRSQEVK